MKINNAGIELIKQFEGCELIAYKCPAGVLTIGYGHTGKDVTAGLKWTQEQANAALRNDLSKFEAGVNKLVKSSINVNQFSALVSFAYNLGLGNLEKSTLLKMVNENPNNTSIDREFNKWINAGGKVLSGLQKRRAAESKLYFSKALAC